MESMYSIIFMSIFQLYIVSNKKLVIGLIVGQA